MKYKNNDLVPHIFLAVVGVILVGVIVTYIMNSVKSTTRVADIIIADTEELAANYTEHDICVYDGEIIRGAEVVNLIKKELGDYSLSETSPLYIEVATKFLETTYINTHINNKYIDDIKNFSSASYYIKPTALFAGEVIRTENRVIIGVKFTQK